MYRFYSVLLKMKREKKRKNQTVNHSKDQRRVQHQKKYLAYFAKDRGEKSNSRSLLFVVNNYNY